MFNNMVKKSSSSDKNINLIIVSYNEVGRRIDNFLLTCLKGLPKDRIYNILRRGEIRVNKKRVRWLYRLNFGDVIRIPPINKMVSRKITVQFPEAVKKKLYDSFLYEDDSLIVINKPSGVAVHGGTGLSFSLIDGLRIIRPELNFLKLVHRLDRDASGVLLLAKNHYALMQLHTQLHFNKIKKDYFALVAGQCDFFFNIVVTFLKKEFVHSGLYSYKIVRTTKDIGKYSKTCFMVKERFVLATLLKVTPITGRTHQIRVHACHIGHPIACDSCYGDIHFNQSIALSGLNRLFLHAYRLQFIHPENGKLFYVEAPMDQILLNCLSFLRN